MSPSKNNLKTHHQFRLKERDIDPNALQIVRVLQKRGFTTYLVGGCVRDLLLGKHPKDFDIATLAKPQEVRQSVHNAFVIGKRFRLVLVKRGEVQYEVATFRRDAGPADVPEDVPAGDNLFGTPEEDARRRDFTINALFYDPVKHTLIDFANGLPDLEEGVIRMIGDPNVRLREDPIRILRGVRLAHMIRFSLDKDLRQAMHSHAESLSATALPRRREEFLKFLRLENPALPFLTCLDLGVMDFISPRIAAVMRDTGTAELFLSHLLSFHKKELQSPVELFAALVVAYYASARRGDIHPDIKSHDLLEDPDILPLMRDDLGMFKSEQIQLAKALQLMTLLLKKKEFISRGTRRKRALVSNESFPLALKLAEREHWLSAHDLHFWQNEYSELLNDPEFTPTSGGGSSKRRRRPRRRPRPKEHQSLESTDRESNGHPNKIR